MLKQVSILTLPCRSFHTTVISFALTWWVLQVKTKVQPCNIMGDGSTCSWTGYIRGSNLTRLLKFGLKILQCEPAWLAWIIRTTKQLGKKNTRADFTGSTKSCHQVQNPSQTNCDHGNACSKSLFSRMCCKTYVFQPFGIDGIYKITYRHPIREQHGKINLTN